MLLAKENTEHVVYPFPVKYVQLRNGIEIAYSDEGIPHGKALLFVHGLGTGVPVWEKNIMALSAGYRCIALDLPGHGFSTKSEFSYSIDFYARALEDFIAALELREVCLIGHSLGGQIAACVACNLPETVKELVFVSPAGMEPFWWWERQLLIANTAAVVNSGNAFAQHHLAYLTGLLYETKKINELLSHMAYHKHDAWSFSNMFFRSAEASLLDPTHAKLKDIKQKCLLLVGDLDEVSAINYFRGKKYADFVIREARKIPNCRFKRIAEAGHFLQYQLPAEFNQALRLFLDYST